MALKSESDAKPFGGPLALLVDRFTGSASEVFASGMQSVGRARVFGDTTAGAVLPSALDRLPNGDMLQHPIADFVTLTGDVPTTTILADYRHFGDLLLPTTITQRLAGGQVMVTRIGSVDHRPIDKSLFIPPTSVRRLIK